ncbi:hypothetical protein GCM10009090_02630 [[Pseudomonas] boreopolis]|uniref:Uncharacterized protein n=1 Tax=Xanthomonas boreopolis TaxID=86183 RepID=A0A919KGJ2_9XANT|nr:hypothetical protein GCM10009090_02630 [[Pseudomonas] boreopolis]
MIDKIAEVAEAARHQAVQHRDPEAFGQQPPAKMGTDEAGTAGDECVFTLQLF